jgi:methyl-accepting chemotaxis protein
MKEKIKSFYNVFAQRLIWGIAWLILGLGIIITVFIWWQKQNSVVGQSTLFFQKETERITTQITLQMSDYEDVLRAGRGLFLASDSVLRLDWSNFIDALAIESNYAGIEAAGFIANVPADQISDFVNSMRLDNAPFYSLIPNIPRTTYYPIAFIKSNKKNSNEGLGFDINAADGLLQTAFKARDFNIPILSEQVKIDYVTQTDKRLTFMLPVYNPTKPSGSVTERREALRGWVYLILEAEAVFKSIAGNSSQINFEVFDVEDNTGSTYSLYKSANLTRTEGQAKPQYIKTETFSIGGRQWLINYSTNPLFDAIYSLWDGLILAGVSLAITFLLFTVVFLALRTRVKNTRQIREQKERLQIALSEIQDRQQSSEKVSHKVLLLAAELKATAGEQAVESQEQVSTLTEITTSVNELSQTSGAIAEQAQQINQAISRIAVDSQRIAETTSRSARKSEEGIKSVERTQIASQEVAQLYQELLEMMHQLNEKNANMRHILDLLATITNETHLLSLNAAIEAAGAGEYGDRFRVVAQQVKNLATRSSQANKEVVSIIRDVENMTGQVVNSAEDGYSKAVEMQTVSVQAGNIIEGMRDVSLQAERQAQFINQSAHAVSELSEIIKIATNQQRTASQQVLSALNSLNDSAHQSAMSSNMLSNTATDLEEVSQNLSSSLAA